MQKDVIQRFATALCGVHEDHQVLQNLLLALEIRELRRTYRTLELFVRRRQMLFRGIQILVHNAVNVAVCPNGSAL